MQITCTQKNLLKGVNTVGKIVSARGSLPVLSNILIKAKGGYISLAATDLELGVTTQITGKIESEGSFTLPGRLFGEFVANCNDENITIELEADAIKLSSERYSAHINGIDATEFPIIPHIKGSPVASFNALGLQKALAQVVFAASHDETRPILTGVYFRLAAKQCWIAATDSYRLAEKKITLENEIKEEMSVVVPYSLILELLRIITIEQEDIDFYIGDNQVMFTTAKTQIVSRIIEGKYPEYEKIIPEKFTNDTVVLKNDLNQALKMTTIFARESANNVRMKIKQNSLDLIAVAPQVGDNKATLQTESTGEDMEIAFNAKYISDCLAQIEQEKVVLKTNKAAGQERVDPGLIQGLDDHSYRYIIMPLQLDD